MRSAGGSDLLQIGFLKTSLIFDAVARQPGTVGAAVGAAVDDGGEGRRSRLREDADGRGALERRGQRPM